MAAPSKQVAEFGQAQITLPSMRGSRAAWQCGDIVLDGGVAYVLPGLANALNGDVVTGQYVGTFEIGCATGTTAAKGDAAYYDEATRLVVTGSGAGIIAIGKFSKAKVSGELVAQVRLNDK